MAFGRLKPLNIHIDPVKEMEKLIKEMKQKNMIHHSAGCQFRR